MAKDINELLNTDVEAIVAEGQKGFKRTKKKVIFAIVAFITLCAIAAGAYQIVQQVQKANKYNHVVELLEAEKYDEATDFLSRNVKGRELLDTEEGAALLTEARNGQDYTKAQRYFTNEQYEEAQKRFEKLKDYKDSASKALEAQYMRAMSHFDAGEYDIAIELFSKMGDYADCKEKLAETKQIFEELGDHKDSADLVAYEKSLSFYSGNWKHKSGTLLVSSNLQITVAESRTGSKENYLLVETTDNAKKERSDWVRIEEAGRFYVTSEGLKSGASSPFGDSELKLIDDNTIQFIHEGLSGEYVRE